MAERIEHFTVTVAASTAQASPAAIALAFDPGTVENIEIVVPPGHNGLTGIALRVAGQQVIPHTAGAFIIANGEVIDWPLEGFLNTGDWSALAFNTDVYAHSFYLRFLVNEVAAPGADVPGLVTPRALALGAVTPRAGPFPSGPGISFFPPLFPEVPEIVEEVPGILPREEPLGPIIRIDELARFAELETLFSFALHLVDQHGLDFTQVEFRPVWTRFQVAGGIVELERLRALSGLL